MTRRNKFGAVRTMVDGILFDSAFEAERYQQLRLWEKSGGITELRRQIPYSIDINLKHIGKYRADFAYKFRGKEVVEDVKGLDTPLGVFKIKCVEALYGIKINIIRRQRRGRRSR